MLTLILGIIESQAKASEDNNESILKFAKSVCPAVCLSVCLSEQKMSVCPNMSK